jgi:two-component system, OmpR family, sensor histidine kinase KdpD
MSDEPKRPTPEELLERYGLAMRGQAHEHGRLRVYLGAAPGVGTTYAMLNEGRRLMTEGRDVVVGFVETHGRAETAAQLGDLEVVPRRNVTYRGVVVEEMDTEAILRRKPGVVLVDELAHTNAPGSPREKRWEDVEVLRRAGVDVITTVNVQHLESLNDVVESITGIEVRETLPDRVLEGATEVQLVDLPVPALLERLEQGKVYPPQRARQATQHFFREGNLTALRELALRRTAAGVDESLERYMREHEIPDVWPASERVLVLFDDGLAAGTVLRNAWRLSSALRGELLAVAVAPPGGLERLPIERRTALQRNLSLAEDLGAVVRVVEGASPVEAVADLCLAENVNIVVLGHEVRRGWRAWFGRTTADHLFDLLENVDVYLVEA